MKKIIILVVFGFLFFSGNSLFAQSNFEDCFEIERLKAKSDGLGSVEAADLANKVCKAKSAGNQNKENTTQNSSKGNAKRKTGGIFISVAPIFIGTIREEVESPTFVRTGAFAPKGSINNGSGTILRLGYKFPKIPFRVYYASYNFKANITGSGFDFDTEIQNSFVSADWYGATGWFAGIGFGTGKEKVNSFSESGSLSVFTAGKERKPKPKMQQKKYSRIGLNLLNSRFSYDLGSTKWTIATNALFLNAGFIF